MKINGIPISQLLPKLGVGVPLAKAVAGAPEIAYTLWESLWLVAFSCVIIASLIAGWHIRSHLRYNPNPKIKKVLVRIFFLIPLYAIESLCAMTFEEYGVLLETARDCYEVFVIFSFFQFMVEFLGGEKRVILSLEPAPHVPPLCCVPTWKPAQNFLSKTKAGTLQYIFVRVICSMLQFWFVLAGTDSVDDLSPKSLNFWIVFVVNFSQMWAIYCLVLFYMAMKHKLKPINPIAKMLCIKGLVFFTWWQSVGIGIGQAIGLLKVPVEWYGDEVSKAMQDFLICLEMVGFAIAFKWAFPYTDFVAKEDRGAAQPVFKSLLTAANVVDVIQEVPIVKKEERGPELKVEMQTHAGQLDFHGEEINAAENMEDRIAVRMEEFNEDQFGMGMYRPQPVVVFRGKKNGPSFEAFQDEHDSPSDVR